MKAGSGPLLALVLASFAGAGVQAATGPTLVRQSGTPGVGPTAQAQPYGPAEAPSSPMMQDTIRRMDGTRYSAPADMADPLLWCARSTEPSKCHGRAAAEHGICVGAGAAHYDACRFALDEMYSR